MEEPRMTYSDGERKREGAPKEETTGAANQCQQPHISSWAEPA